jgi:tRNA G18 (ribose-2'-O)-methylase SpoU
MADELIRVPIGGRAESLNVAVATGVILYESLRQRNLRREKRSQKRNRTP